MPTRRTPRRQSSRGATLSDAVILLAAIALLFGGLLPAVTSRSRETANRVKCASNLRHVGMAILLYSNANGGAYPRTMHDAETAATTQYTGWRAPGPFTSTGPADNDVTAALFLLLRTQDVTPQAFVCPTATDARPWDFDGRQAATVSNFPHRGVLSYGYANPYPTAAAEKLGYRLNNSIRAEFAVAADMSSGIAALATVPVTGSAAEMRPINSRSHDGDGQNILFGDGHVEFLQHPFVGVGRDNIYTAAGGTAPTGKPFATTPMDANDSVILPTILDGPAPPVIRADAGPWAWLAAAVLFATLALAWAFVYRPARPLVRLSAQ